ncbi:hypothetical protein [Bradyrhizobium genosp. P]|uniref:hypothetical protein n=1 Tax=Bradyrhizobium genosp. P TaxID=83641 RepID=UPI003CED0276
MPVARYFLFVGGVLLALLFALDAIVPQETVVAATGPSSPSFDRSTVRIRSTQKLPERVVYDTNLPTIVPPQINVVAAAAPARETSAQARVRDTFAQFIPETKNDARGKPAAAEAKPPEQQAQLQPVQAPKKHRVARARLPTQPQRFAQPGQYQYQPYRVAQQQPHFGLFSGFGTW